MGQEGGTYMNYQVSILKLILKWKFHFKIHFLINHIACIPTFDMEEGLQSNNKTTRGIWQHFLTIQVYSKTWKNNVTTSNSPRTQSTSTLGDQGEAEAVVLMRTGRMVAFHSLCQPSRLRYIHPATRSDRWPLKANANPPSHWCSTEAGLPLGLQHEP